jgi:ribonucleoside-triphosphate reductase
MLMKRMQSEPRQAEHTVSEIGNSHFTQIQKRDGRLVSFDACKIERALLEAGHATGEFGQDIARQLTIRVLSLAQTVLSNKLPTVETVQDLVVQVLLDSPFRKTAIAYIIYREHHARMREIVQSADCKLISSYLNHDDWKVRENSNMNYSIQGLNNFIASNVSETYYLGEIYSPEVRNAHVSGDMHIHDLGFIGGYCVGWDIEDLLLSGFKGVSGKIESKPAKHFRTALLQIVNYLYTLQGEAAGAQAFSHVTTFLAPFIRHDGLIYEEVKQYLQEGIYNLNVATRVGGQAPFTNLTLDLELPLMFADKPVIIGGELQNQTYGDFQPEMVMFNRAFLEVMSEGDAKGRPFTFPIPTCNITEDLNWDSREMDLLCTVTAKYGTPYFANFVNSDMSPEDTRSMCCRLRLDMRALEKRGGGLFGANPLTGSIGVVTINMPRIGYVSNNKTEFLERLNNLMEVAGTSLEIKRKVLERLTDNGLYPYSKFYLRAVKEHYAEYWHSHFSTIGLIGMNEACLNLLSCDIGTSEGVTFAIEVLDFMRDKLLEFQKKTGNLYNIEATPAEGATCRLAKLDKKSYPDIICANEEEISKGTAPFYTNSTQLPVNYTDDIFRVLELQDELQSRYTGGTVLHIYLGEAVADPQSVKAFIRKVCENYHLPYFTITPTFSVCGAHGYITGEHNKCPKCGTEIEVYSRVVGYLRPVKQWNEGKQAEFRLRSKYTIGGFL